MLIRLFFILCVVVLTSCSRDKQVIELSEKFLNAYDAKDFKLAYNLLSLADKNAMTADSFYIIFYKHEEKITRLMMPSMVSTIIDKRDGDTIFVRQVCRIPDYDLISKIKPNDTKTSEFIAKLLSDKSLPMKLDSSRTIRIIKERGDYSIYIGLDKYRRLEKCWADQKEFYLSQIKIEPINIEVNSYKSGDYLAKATIIIYNQSVDTLIISRCSITIDTEIYEPDWFDFYITVEPKSKISKVVYLTKNKQLLAKYLPHGSDSGLIDGSRILIVPKNIDYDYPLYAQIQKKCVEESCFDGFSFLIPSYN